MAHPQQVAFCLKVRMMFPQYFDNAKVLDVGSLDINGNNRYLFTGLLTSYTGIDVGPGKNVDVVSKGHEWDAPSGCYRTIISTECFEHDMCYKKTLANIARMLAPRGLFLFTCATTGRPQHGTQFNNPADSPLTCKMVGWRDYYENLTERHIKDALPVNTIFDTYEFSTNESTHDLYFYGIKK